MKIIMDIMICNWHSVFYCRTIANRKLGSASQKCGTFQLRPYENSLIRAKLWDEETHAEALKAIINECACSMAHKPLFPPRVSLSSVENGDEICVNL
jgi:hypothetical protein